MQRGLRREKINKNKDKKNKNTNEGTGEPGEGKTATTKGKPKAKAKAKAKAQPKSKATKAKEKKEPPGKATKAKGKNETQGEATKAKEAKAKPKGEKRTGDHNKDEDGAPELNSNGKGLDRPLGCPKCRWNEDIGCKQCKNPSYRPRKNKRPENVD